MDRIPNGALVKAARSSVIWTVVSYDDTTDPPSYQLTSQFGEAWEAYFNVKLHAAPIDTDKKVEPVQPVQMSMGLDEFRYHTECQHPKMRHGYCTTCGRRVL